MSRVRILTKSTRSHKKNLLYGRRLPVSCCTVSLCATNTGTSTRVLDKFGSIEKLLGLHEANSSASGAVSQNQSLLHRASAGGNPSYQSFLDEVIVSLERSEFDPCKALEWIQETDETQRKEICQHNFAAGIEDFIDSSYWMIANTQIGKTNSFFFLMFKAGVKGHMPSILLTQNGCTETTRFEASVKKFNDLLTEHGDDVVRRYKNWRGFQVSHRVPVLLAWFEQPCISKAKWARGSATVSVGCMHRIQGFGGIPLKHDLAYS